MKKNVYAVKVREGCYDEYKIAHDTLWPEIGENLDHYQVSIGIYYLEPFLFVFQTAPTDQAWTTNEEPEVVHRWSKYMAELLETDANGKVIIHNVDEAFVWGAFKD